MEAETVAGEYQTTAGNAMPVDAVQAQLDFHNKLSWKEKSPLSQTRLRKRGPVLNLRLVGSQVAEIADFIYLFIYLLFDVKSVRRPSGETVTDLERREMQALD